MRFFFILEEREMKIAFIFAKKQHNCAYSSEKCNHFSFFFV